MIMPDLRCANCKCRRGTRSMQGAATYDFADAFDFYDCAKTDLKELLERLLLLSVFSYSESLLDVIMKCSRTQERCLIIDLQAHNDAYAVHEINNVGFIRGPNNPGEGHTKFSKCHALHYMPLNRRCGFIFEKWAIRFWNAASPNNYFSTVPLVYDRSCCSNKMHISQDITFSCKRSCENGNFQTVPVEGIPIFSIPFHSLFHYFLLCSLIVSKVILLQFLCIW